MIFEVFVSKNSDSIHDHAHEIHGTPTRVLQDLLPALQLRILKDFQESKNLVVVNDINYQMKSSNRYIHFSEL